MGVIFQVDKITEGIGGGKARGLAFLKKAGMNIPETFVVTEFSKQELKKFITSLPNHRAYAVRSSASGEDGEELSFAGQFDSFLNLNGEMAILNAVEKCFQSASSQNVKSYKDGLHSANGSVMNVIVQEMVQPEFSGVLFTADPVRNRHDKITVSIVKGIGEDLMSGLQTGETVSLYKVHKDQHNCKLLNKETFNKLISQALDIESVYGKPADLEWAIDKEGNIFWLQLRPITGAGSVHLNELDDKPVYDKPIYTRGNIGEMMPGPVTPLTLSTFARSIDYGLQILYSKTRAIPEISDSTLFVHSYYNHLFFEVNSLYKFPQNILLSKKGNIDFSVVSQEVPGVKVRKEAGFVRRLGNFIRMISYLSGAAKAKQDLEKMYNEFRIDCPDDVGTCYNNITENMHVLMKAWDLHYVSSSQSGSNYSTILNLYSKGKVPQKEHQEKVARFFTDIPDIESAQVLKAIDELAHLLVRCLNIDKDFLQVDINGSIKFLKEISQEEIRIKWAEFINRHGHRGVREAELLEKEWAVDPAPIVEGLKAKVMLLINNPELKPKEKITATIDISKENLNYIQKIILKKILPKARKAVARREQTKALAIGVQHQFKLAYRNLAKLMVRDGMLDDEDQIFFLKHEEIGELLESGNYEKWKAVSTERRNIYPEMQKLIFEDLTFGVPCPVEEQRVKFDGELSGIPVSRGVAEGNVRLISTIGEAAKLKSGEIMVVKFTDIGWTPFYSIAGGLITEIGSPLSHGAVVAREYGLPTVVSMKGAMDILKDGQKIRLDAVEGKVEVLEK